jgi:UDP-N-acetylmuramate--alanine ligase
LLPIYPARELPMEGVTSDVLLEKIENSNKKLLQPQDVIDSFSVDNCDVLLTIGAGDIDRIVDKLKLKIEAQLQV